MPSQSEPAQGAPDSLRTYEGGRLAKPVGMLVAHTGHMPRTDGTTGIAPPWATHGPRRKFDMSPDHPVVAALEALARTAPIDGLPDLIAQVEGLKARLYARLNASNSTPPTARDRLLNVKEAAQKLGRSTDWLYRHSSELPFIVRDGRLLRFSEQGIEDYIKRRMGH